jgi:hypothetical protein
VTNIDAQRLYDCLGIASCAATSIAGPTPTRGQANSVRPGAAIPGSCESRSARPNNPTPFGKPRVLDRRPAAVPHVRYRSARAAVVVLGEPSVTVSGARGTGGG